MLRLLTIALVCMSAGRIEAQSYDVVFAGGRIMDGTGNPWVRGDVGVRDGEIVAVGRVDTSDAVRVVDARGEDGQQGLDMASSQSPNIILLDMSLPIVDGWDVARQLKAASNTKDIPIIALTAHAMEGDRKKSLEAGCDDYETKPYKIERLIGKIELILGLA